MAASKPSPATATSSSTAASFTTAASPVTTVSLAAAVSSTAAPPTISPATSVSVSLTRALLSHGVQSVHHVVDAPAEVVVQLAVLGVEAVVAVGRRLVGQVDAVPPAAHHGPGRPHVGVGAGRDGGVDGRAERG